VVVNVLASSDALFRQGTVLCSVQYWCVCCVPGCFVSLCFILSSWCISLYGGMFMAVISLCNIDDSVEVFLCFTKELCY
jgi:hypothetical protein